MSFTWTGDPAASTIEAIRWEVVDIVNTTQAPCKFQDSEVQYAYDQEHSILCAAARLCEQLSVRYSDASDRTMGPLRVSMTEKSSLYADKAKMLRRRAMIYAEPYAGGVSKAKDAIFEEDSDLNQPDFKKGMMDNG
jgi:hypothetical protein